MSETRPKHSPQNVVAMKEAMAELSRAGASMRAVVRESNDPTHQAFFQLTLERLDLIVANEREGITFALADDLETLRSELRRLRIPDVDPDLGTPTPALKTLRSERGNLIDSLDTARESAARLGLRPRNVETGALHIEPGVAAEALIRLDERLRVTEESVEELRAAAKAADEAKGEREKEAASQYALVNFDVRSIKVEISAARFETRVNAEFGPATVDLSALERSLAAVREIVGDFKQMALAMGPALADGVRSAGGALARAADRSWSGFKTVVRLARRKTERRAAAEEPRRSPAPLSPQEERALRAGDHFRELPEGPEMVVVPAGSFLMGSPPEDDEAFSAELPQHEVTIARAFAVGTLAVTFEEWDACVAAGGCGGYRPDDENWGRERLPVINVSWKDAQAYVAWLSQRTGKRYRLLSEAEWEYVARAGATTHYWMGDEISHEEANFDRKINRTVEADRFAPNRFGLHNVHGNVWEWVEDCWNGDYVGAPKDGSAWTIGDSSLRVLRGGSWYINPRFARAACRNNLYPERRSVDVGFRVARTLTL